MSKKSNKLDEHLSELIEKAWCDKTSFDNIAATDHITENEIKKILRKKLKKNRYILWRKRIKKIKANKSF